ncbi:MAG TPA: hypothetical protein VMM16_04840 [Verrucomicrobiae bacterium]|nr:hypothetical protein [Verrucomicrobiae bacterium]
MATTSLQSSARGAAISALDPQGQPTGVFEDLSMAPRLDTLRDKTIYLVDVGFAGGYEFLEEVRAWFHRNMAGVSVVLRRKRGNLFLDDPELWAEVKDKGHAVIFGVGG